jgi:hypothetical protein
VFGQIARQVAQASFNSASLAALLVEHGGYVQVFVSMPPSLRPASGAKAKQAPSVLVSQNLHMLAYSAACVFGTVVLPAVWASTRPLTTSAEASATAPAVREMRIFMGSPLLLHCYHNAAATVREGAWEHIFLEFIAKARHQGRVVLKEHP